MKNKNTKNLIISVIAVLLIIAVVGGATFAYFQWTTGEDQQTSVNVTIEAGGITMHIEPEQTEFVGLYPTVTCTSNVRYGDALVTIDNKTGTLALPSFKLNAKFTKGGTGTVTTAELEHIHYAVALVETTVDEDGNAVKGEATGTCLNPTTAADVGTGTQFTNNNLVATGTFADISTNGEWSDLPSATSEYLPRQYSTETHEATGITFKAGQNAVTHQYFRVYVWIDEGYTSITTGTNVSDPLQNAKIEISWSANSMVQQISE